jgi:hypothetical protein
MAKNFPPPLLPSCIDSRPLRTPAGARSIVTSRIPEGMCEGKWTIYLGESYHASCAR